MDHWLTAPEVAILLGVSRQYIARLRREKKLRYRRRGGHFWYHGAEVLQLALRQRRGEITVEQHELIDRLVPKEPPT